MQISHVEAAQFKSIAQHILDTHEFNISAGICLSINNKMNSKYNEFIAYDIMHGILGTQLYSDGLGSPGQLNDTRIKTLRYIVSLSLNDIIEYHAKGYEFTAENVFHISVCPRYCEFMDKG